MNFKFLYFIGIIFLFFGLLLLNAYELFEHAGSSNKEKVSKTLIYSLLGVFPTIIGILLIERSNRNIKNKI